MEKKKLNKSAAFVLPRTGLDYTKLVGLGIDNTYLFSTNSTEPEMHVVVSSTLTPEQDQ